MKNELKVLLGASALLLAGAVWAQSKAPQEVESDLPPRGGTIPIPDDGYDGTLGSMACQVVTISDTAPVEDVDFDVALEHTWIGDLVIKLVSPAGTIATVLSRPGFDELADDGVGCCGASDNLVLSSPITFSTSNGLVDAETMGGTSTDNVVCQDDGECIFIPNPGAASDSGDLATLFDGEEAAGDWQLCVGDSVGFDTGNLGAVTLDLTLGVEIPETAPVPVNSPWALAILVLLLAGLGVLVIRRMA